MAVAGVNVVVRTVTLGRTSGGFGMQISSLRHCLGVFVSGLTGRGPAASAGMQDGDVILAINGRSVVNAPFEDVLARLKAEDTLHLKLLQKRSSLSEQACVSDTAEDPHARMTVDLIALAAGPNGFGMKISVGFIFFSQILRCWTYCSLLVDGRKSFRDLYRCGTAWQPGERGRTVFRHHNP